MPEQGEVLFAKSMGQYKIIEYTNGYMLCNEEDKSGVVYSSKDFQRVYIDEVNKNEDYSSELLLNIFRARLIETGNLCAHGAVTVLNGAAVMFCGLSTAGKSTQARLWRECLGSWALNNDKPALLCKNRKLLVAGTPWSGKEPCYINREIPLRAVVFVEKAPVNEIRQLSRVEAFSLMFPNYMAMPIADDQIDKYTDIVEKITGMIPCYCLKCTISEEAVKVAYNQIFDDIDYDEAKSINGGGYRMKRNNNFVIRNIADDYIILARGSIALDFSATIITNELGAFLWGKLAVDKSMGDLVTDVLEEYDVDEATAREDIEEFVARLRDEGLLEMEAV